MAASDAAEQPKVELDEEAKRLQLEQFKAQARKAIAEANAGTAKAGLYEPKAEPVKGETKLGAKSGSLLAIVALRALRDVAAAIGRDVDREIGDDHSLLIVENRALAATDAPYTEMKARFGWFGERFQDAKEQLAAEPPQQWPLPPKKEGEKGPEAFALIPAVIGAMQLGSAAMSLVGLAADVVGMFKTNYSLEGRDVSLDYPALAALVAENIPNSTIPIRIDGVHTLERSPTVQRFENLLEQRRELEALALGVETVELAATTAEIDELSAQIAAARTALQKAREAGDTEKAERAVQHIAELSAQRADRQVVPYLARRAQVATAKGVVAAFDQYCVAITTVPEEQSYPPLIAAALRDPLHENCDIPGFPTPIDYVLYLAIASSGGDVATKEGHFRRNERVGLIAGVQATYVLVDRAGVVRRSGSRGGYSAATFNVDKNKLEWANTAA